MRNVVYNVGEIAKDFQHSGVDGVTWRGHTADFEGFLKTVHLNDNP